MSPVKNAESKMRTRARRARDALTNTEQLWASSDFPKPSSGLAAMCDFNIFLHMKPPCATPHPLLHLVPLTTLPLILKNKCFPPSPLVRLIPPVSAASPSTSFVFSLRSVYCSPLFLSLLWMLTHCFAPLLPFLPSHFFLFPPASRSWMLSLPLPDISSQ